MENFDKENRYLQAKEKVGEIRKFYGGIQIVRERKL